MASNAAVEGLSGAIGGIVALIATYPLMTVCASLPRLHSVRPMHFC